MAPWRPCSLRSASPARSPWGLADPRESWLPAGEQLNRARRAVDLYRLLYRDAGGDPEAVVAVSCLHAQELGQNIWALMRWIRELIEAGWIQQDSQQVGFHCLVAIPAVPVAPQPALRSAANRGLSRSCQQLLRLLLLRSDGRGCVQVPDRLLIQWLSTSPQQLAADLRELRRRGYLQPLPRWSCGAWWRHGRAWQLCDPCRPCRARPPG